MGEEAYMAEKAKHTREYYRKKKNTKVGVKSMKYDATSWIVVTTGNSKHRHVHPSSRIIWLPKIPEWTGRDQSLDDMSIGYFITWNLIYNRFIKLEQTP